MADKIIKNYTKLIENIGGIYENGRKAAYHAVDTTVKNPNCRTLSGNLGAGAASIILTTSASTASYILTRSRKARISDYDREDLKWVKTV